MRATTIGRDQITSDRWSKLASNQIAFHAFYSFQWNSKRSWLYTCRAYEVATWIVGSSCHPQFLWWFFFYIFLFCNGLFTFHWLFRCCLPNKPSIRQGWQNSAQNRYKNILRPDKCTYAFPRHCDYYTILVETGSNKCPVWAILTCALGFQWLRFWRRTSLTYCHLTGQLQTPPRTISWPVTIL